MITETVTAAEPVTTETPSPSLEARIDRLMILCRARDQMMRAEFRDANQIKANIRWAAGKLKGKEKAVMTPEQRARGRAVSHLVNPSLEPACSQYRKDRKVWEKEIEAIAGSLPAWAWVDTDVRGIGAKGFGLLIGHTGDLSKYSGPSKVWKRMGLACIDGERQRKIAGTTPGKVAQALQHGYSPTRHALAFVLSECLLKQNKGAYRALYDTRKALELTKLPADAKGRQGWAHHRALRFMVKRFIRDLWCVWNGKELEVSA